MAQMVTIREAIPRLKSDGLEISEYSLRTFVKTGKIPARKIGSKQLLFYPNIVSFLECRDGSDNALATVAAVSGIRRVEL